MVGWLMFAVMLAGLSLSWRTLDQQWQRNFEHQLEIATTQATLRLQDFVGARILAVQSIARVAETKTARDDEDFVTRSLIIQQQFGGFKAMNWVDPDGTIRIVAPAATNEGAKGRNVLNHPIAREAFLAARSTRTARITPPLDLFQGGRGFASYVPVVQDGTTIGFINAVFLVEPIVARSLAVGILESYDLRITDYDDVLYESEGFAGGPQWPQKTATADLLDRHWVVTVRPNNRLSMEYAGSRPDLGYLVAILLAAITSWLIYRALIQQIERLEIERKRRQLEVGFQQASKMEALGRLAGGVAHDFNNILTVILGNAQLIERSTDSDDTRELTRDIVAASERAADLTNQLSAFSKQPIEEPGPLDLNAQLNDLSRILERLLRERIEYTMELAEGLWPVIASRAQVSQIIVNLVVNAADAMPHGGKLTIRTTNRPATENRADEPGSSDWVILEVQDSGMGMDEKTRKSIFEPFFTTKGDTGGTGLGLATLDGIVQTLNGRVVVVSERGQGTRFEIWFPTGGDPSPAVDDPVRQMTPSTSGARILFVEDDAGVRDVMVRALETLGNTVITADNGQEALEILDKNDVRSFDVIVTDAVMPKLDGWALIKIVRQLSRIRIVICSGYTDQDVDVPKLLRNNVEFLAKPYTAAQLAELLVE